MSLPGREKAQKNMSTGLANECAVSGFEGSEDG